MSTDELHSAHEPQWWRAAQAKLKQIDLVTKLDDLKIPPGNDLHALKDDRAGRHAIKVNDQYRITFRWEGHDAAGDPARGGP